MSEPALLTVSSVNAEQAPAWRWISRPSPRAVVAVLTIIAAILRILYLGKPSLWHDEAVSVAFTHMSWRDMLTKSNEIAMSPYQVVLRLWIALFGDTEASLRMPSVIFSVATLPFIYSLARRLVGARVALVAALLFAVNVFSIRYAQEARCYSLMTLLVVCSWVYFLRCLDAESIPNYAAYVATTVLGAYAHIFSTLSYPAQWIPLARRSRRMKLPFGLIATVVVICLLILPKGLSVLLTDVGQANWVSSLAPAWISELFCDFSGALTTGRGEFLLTTIYMIAAGCGVLALLFDNRKLERAEDRRYFILLGFAFPLAVVLVISLVKPLLVVRYLSEAFPFFVILCAVGLCRMRPRWIGAACLMTIAALSLYQDYLYYRYDSRDDWRALTSYVLDDAKARDAIMFLLPTSRGAYDYYVSRSDFAEPPAVIFPDWDAQLRIGGIDAAQYFTELNLFEPIVMRAINDAPKRYDRLWLAQWPIDFFQNSSDQPFFQAQRKMNKRLLAAIGDRYRLNSEKDFGQIHLLLYDRDADAPN
jgi:mannosyltransferase